MDYQTFQDDPRYQRAAQRIAALPPERQAVLRGRYGALDAHFAGMDAKKKLTSEAKANDRQYMDSRLGLAESALGHGAQARADRLDFAKDQALLSSAVGLAQVGAAGYFGKKRADVDLALAKKILGLGVK